MNGFSVYNYENLSDSTKKVFNKTLAKNLIFLLDEIRVDDTLSKTSIEKFITSDGESLGTSSVVSTVYSMITAGIQAGSGNQNLYHSVLRAYTQSWDGLQLLHNEQNNDSPQNHIL